MTRRTRIALAAIVALVLAAAAFSLSSAGASVSTQLQTAQDTLANCQLLAAHSTGTQRQRTRDCVTDQTAIIKLLTGQPTPTVAPTTLAPSQTATPLPPATTAPSTVGPTKPPATPPPGWPNASNTGPTGTLKPMACPTGWVDLNTPGQVLQNVTLDGCRIGVGAPGVIVRNVRATLTDPVQWLAVVKNDSSAVFENVDFAGNDLSTGAVQYAVYGQGNGRFTISRAHLHHCIDCVQGEHVVLTDSWIESLANPPGAHVDGVQCNGSCAGTVIRHNRIDVQYTQTGAVSIFPDFGVANDVLVENNWLSGGSYTIYGGSSPRGERPTNIRIVNNVVDARPGGGWLAYWNGAGAGNVCAGNKTSGGAPLSCG